jgi:hypothetical protein
MNKSKKRLLMIADLQQTTYQKIYKERGYRIEPMQRIVKDIFELNRFWMRGNNNNVWLFAAMGITVQIHQRVAFQNRKTTWPIKE